MGGPHVESEETTELLSDYAWAMDSGEFTLLNEVFTTDAAFSIEVPGADTVGPLRAPRRDRRLISGSVTGMGDQCRHVATNFRVVREGKNDGELTSTPTLVSAADGKATIVSTGRLRGDGRTGGRCLAHASMVIKLDLPFG